MEYTITINAPREKVWNALWNDANYRKWTSAFAEGSRAETDWKKGSKVLFLDRKDTGMVAKIEESIPNEFMSIKHLGIIVNGKEEIEDEEAKQWAGAYENYALKPVDGKTELKVTMGGVEIPKEHEEHFKKAWPKALNILKEIAEAK